MPAPYPRQAPSLVHFPAFRPRKASSNLHLWLSIYLCLCLSASIPSHLRLPIYICPPAPAHLPICTPLCLSRPLSAPRLPAEMDCLFQLMTSPLHLPFRPLPVLHMAAKHPASTSRSSSGPRMNFFCSLSPVSWFTRTHIRYVVVSASWHWPVKLVRQPNESPGAREPVPVHLHLPRSHSIYFAALQPRRLKPFPLICSNTPHAMESGSTSTLTGLPVPQRTIPASELGSC